MSSTRIQVSLKPDRYAVVNELADLQGRPTSKLLAEIVDLVLPHLQRQRDALRDFPRTLAADLEQASSRAAGAAVEALSLAMAGQSPLPDFEERDAAAEEPRAGDGGGVAFDSIKHILNAKKHRAPNPTNRGATNGESPRRGSNLTPPRKPRKGSK